MIKELYYLFCITSFTYSDSELNLDIRVLDLKRDFLFIANVLVTDQWMYSSYREGVLL